MLAVFAVLCDLFLTEGVAKAACMQNDSDAFDRCVVAEAHGACDSRMNSATYTKCFRKALIKSIDDSYNRGMRGQFYHLQEISHCFGCKRGSAGKYSCTAECGGFGYYCWRVNQQNIRECEGDPNWKCRTSSCPTDSCNKVCSASRPDFMKGY
jgi:hypothetical protein